MCIFGEKCWYTHNGNNANVKDKEQHRDKSMNEKEFKVIDEWPVNHREQLPFPKVHY